MPRKLDATSTFDALEDEVLYTRSSLKADARAASLVPRTDTWLSWVGAARAGDLEIREAIADATAMRVVNNGNLDATVSTFAAHLDLAVGGDRSTSRWGAFFKENPSRFIARALAEQTSTVLSWLRSSSDPVLETFRQALETYAGGADMALQRTKDLDPRRAQNWQRREELAHNLTIERDRLFSELAEIARQANLPRDWASMFFLVTKKSTGKSQTDSAPGSTSVSATEPSAP